MLNGTEDVTPKAPAPLHEMEVTAIGAVGNCLNTSSQPDCREEPEKFFVEHECFDIIARELLSGDLRHYCPSI